MSTPVHRIRIRVRAWWLRTTGRRWDHDLLRDAAKRRVDVTPQLEHAQQRAYKAEDDNRALQTRLDAAVAQSRAARVAQVDAEGRNHQLTERVRELGSLLDRYRALLGRSVDRLCPECRDPMPFGMAHYCRRTSEYQEGAAAA